MDRHKEMNCRYAEALIGKHTGLYHGLDIHGVRDQHDPDDPMGTCCEVDDENPQFFSVYARYKPKSKTGCIEVLCIGDFGTYELAKAYACELSQAYNWPIYDYQVKHKPEIPAYAVTDQNGNYVFYTDDYAAAIECKADIDNSLVLDNLPGSAAIMRRTLDDGYELFY